MVAKKSGFDNVLEEIDSNGKFQKIYTYTFNFALVVFAGMCCFNIVLALNVPEHWCHVPGREKTNLTVEEWKNITLPKEMDTRGRISVSKCKMYDISQENLYANMTQLKEIGCQYSWEYDRRWYQQTAPSQHHWVCENDMYKTNALMFSRIGDIIGTILFGQLGDIIGRKPVYYITLANLIFSRLLSIFVSGSYYLFVISMFMGSLSSLVYCQSPVVIAMETTSEDHRAFIAMLQCFGWTLGFCLLPLIHWWLGYWRIFMLATTLPCLLFLIPNKYMIESPRWLASKGKIKECVRELNKIAQTNGKILPPDTAYLLQEKYHELNEKSYGILSLFSNFRLAKNTILLTFSWIVIAMAFYLLFLNSSAIGGNPHLNLLGQALCEYPANYLGRYCCDRFGRRWTATILFFITSVTCIPIIVVIVESESEWLIAALTVLVKFALTSATFANIMQPMEIYPTCVRQSGMALGSFASSVFSAIVPYIAYIGTTYNARFPYIFFSLLCAFGGTAAFFLPETLHKKLPETIPEAQNFGADQKLWSCVGKSEPEPEPVRV